MRKADFREKFEGIMHRHMSIREGLRNNPVFYTETRGMDATIELAYHLLDLVQDHLRLEYPDRYSLDVVNPYEL